MESKPELIYVGDPMCSWCWGIAPIVERLSNRTDIDTRVVVGGLRPGPQAQPLDDGLRQTLAHHWAQVEAKSGQPFDSAALQREGWVYDTELPAIAVTTMRSVAPDQTIRFFGHLQGSFYRDAIDITDPDVYPKLIAEFPVDDAAFLAEMLSEDARTRAWEDFAEARELGVLGFPTVLLRIEDTTQVLSRGYKTQEHFDNQLTYWVEGKQPVTADLGVCSIDDPYC
jgi:putative protein-disulfide isomerase